MASARRTGTNENISTFGDGTRDYTAVSTWEAATDNDLVTAETSEVLECYDDSSPYTISSGISFAGATTNSSYFRIIRAASTDRHNGQLGQGVRFNKTTIGFIFSLNETFFSFQDLIISNTAGSFANGLEFRQDETSAIGVIAVDCVTRSFYIFAGAGDDVYYIDCLSIRSGGNSFEGSATSDVYAYNCTSIDSGASAYTNLTAINCVAQGSVTDFPGSVTTTTCISEDATGDIQATLTFADAGSDDYQLAASDTDAIGAGTDLSSDATYAFDDDITFSLFTPSSWDIGAFMFAPPNSGLNDLNWLRGWYRRSAQP